MEKRNVIEHGRTPVMEKQGSADDFEKRAVGMFCKRTPDSPSEPNRGGDTFDTDKKEQ